MNAQTDQKYFHYLDRLRETGQTNMFGAAPFLIANFGLQRREAEKVLMEWMRTFEETHIQRAYERSKETT
jgi:hypothetical protein